MRRVKRWACWGLLVGSGLVVGWGILAQETEKPGYTPLLWTPQLRLEITQKLEELASNHQRPASAQPAQMVAQFASLEALWHWEEADYREKALALQAAALNLAQAVQKKDREAIEKSWLQVLQARRAYEAVSELAAQQPRPPRAPVTDYQPVIPTRTFHSEMREVVLTLTHRNDPEALAHRATLVAEYITLDALQHLDQPQFGAWAARLREASLSVAQAARNEDEAQVRKAIQTVRQTCRDCHRALRDKDAGALPQ